jgi:hypothetical protein
MSFLVEVDASLLVLGLLVLAALAAAGEGEGAGEGLALVAASGVALALGLGLGLGLPLGLGLLAGEGPLAPAPAEPGAESPPTWMSAQFQNSSCGAGQWRAAGVSSGGEAGGRRGTRTRTRGRAPALGNTAPGSYGAHGVGVALAVGVAAGGVDEGVLAVGGAVLARRPAAVACGAGASRQGSHPHAGLR